jgi:hypothetical protein
MNKRQHPTGNGNVFQDLGIPNAEEHLLKAQLTKEALCLTGFFVEIKSTDQLEY